MQTCELKAQAVDTSQLDSYLINQLEVPYPGRSMQPVKSNTPYRRACSGFLKDILLNAEHYKSKANHVI